MSLLGIIITPNKRGFNFKIPKTVINIKLYVYFSDLFTRVNIITGSPQSETKLHYVTEIQEWGFGNEYDRNNLFTIQLKIHTFYRCLRGRGSGGT